MKNFSVIYENEFRKVYKSNFDNKNGENIIIEISRTYYGDVNKSKNSLPNLWKKYGYTDHLYNSALWIDCEVSDKDGNKYRKYEPTTKLSDDKKRNVINFDWLLEVSEENEKKLLDETVKRFLEG